MRNSSVFVLAVSVLFSWGCFADIDQRAAYIKAYSQHVKGRSGLMAKAFEQKGLSPKDARVQSEIFLEKGIRCHIEALDLYPPEIKRTLFEAIQNGGSYPDAESALRKEVGEAQLDGNSEVMEAFVAASTATMSCLKSDLPNQ